jgi:hypothetical protein
MKTVIGASGDTNEYDHLITRLHAIDSGSAEQSSRSLG